MSGLPPGLGFRTLFRAAAAAKIAGTGIVPPEAVHIEYDWPIPDAKLPAVSVATPRWHNGDRSEGAGGPQYWSTITLQVEYRHQANRRKDVVLAIDTATQAIETVLQSFIVYRPKNSPFRRIVASDGEMALNSDGEKHEGGAALTFVFEYSTDYLPVLSDYLYEVVVAAVREWAVGDSRVDQALTEILAGADIRIPQ